MDLKSLESVEIIKTPILLLIQASHHSSDPLSTFASTNGLSIPCVYTVRIE